MVVHRYGKSSSELCSIKSSFFDDNDALLKQSLELNKVYASQPERLSCKVCESDLQSTPIDLNSHGVQYKICRNCGHLNGLYQETDYFHSYVYSEDSHNPNKYDSNYIDRLKHIYLPKAEFLLDICNKQGISNELLSVTDFGCGGGQFVNSLLSLGIKAEGYDVSSHSIESAKEYLLLTEPSPHKSPDDYFHKLGHVDDMLRVATDCQSLVQSYIGVLEHVKSPTNAINAFCSSGSTYLYFSVPLFSLSAIIENCFSNIFPRQLSSDHTHLFTHKSIAHLMQSHGLNIIASWHFGTDILDLRRSIMHTVAQNESSQSILDLIGSEIFGSNIIDDLQLILDKSKLSSEVHIIAKKIY